LFVQNQQLKISEEPTDFSAPLSSHKTEWKTAGQIPSSSSLKCAQYVTATRDRRNVLRVSHSEFPLVSSCDFIAAPLSCLAIGAVENSYIGGVMKERTKIASVFILTAATDRAVKYMNTRITKIVVLGWGEGILGATDCVDFGTARTQDWKSEYEENSGLQIEELIH
jgi:hypothetical protein